MDYIYIPIHVWRLLFNVISTLVKQLGQERDSEHLDITYWTVDYAGGWITVGENRELSPIRHEVQVWTPEESVKMVSSERGKLFLDFPHT